MTDKNGKLRYYGLGSLTLLTITGWLLDKIPLEVTLGAFAAVTLVVTADIYKHKND